MFADKKPKAFNRHIRVAFYSPYRNRAVHLSRLKRVPRFVFDRWSQLFGRMSRFRFNAADQFAYGRQ